MISLLLFTDKSAVAILAFGRSTRQQFTLSSSGHSADVPFTRARKGAAVHLCAPCGCSAPHVDDGTSVTAGTIFQDTRTPLTTRFLAMSWVTCQKTGASALQLQHILGLGSYLTAWSWLHKLRRAMVRPCRGRPGGRIEVDETCWGAVEAGVCGRQSINKVLVPEPHPLLEDPGKAQRKGHRV